MNCDPKKLIVKFIEDQKTIEDITENNLQIPIEDIINARKMTIKAREYAMLDEKKYDSTAEMLYNTARYLNPELTKEVETSLHAFHLNKRRIDLADLVFSEVEIDSDKGEIPLNDAPYLEDKNYKRI